MRSGLRPLWEPLAYFRANHPSSHGPPRIVYHITPYVMLYLYRTVLCYTMLYYTRLDVRAGSRPEALSALGVGYRKDDRTE